MGDKSKLCVWCGRSAPETDPEGYSACMGYREDCPGNELCGCSRMLAEHDDDETCPSEWRMPGSLVET